MKQYIEIFIDTIFLLFICYISLSFIHANLQIQNAKNYHHNVITQIEASDCNQNVINQFKTEATKRYGYKGLTVKNVTTNNQLDERKCFYVCLTYDISLPFLGKTKTCTIEGYAR